VNNWEKFKINIKLVTYFACIVGMMFVAILAGA